MDPIVRVADRMAYRLLNPVLDEGKESVLGLAAYVHVLDIEMYLDLRTFGIMKFVELIDEPSWR